MGSSSQKGRVRSALPIVLLIMILMRLVWMQLRSYPVQLDTRALMSLETLISLPMGGNCDTLRSSYRQGLAPLQATIAAAATTFPPLNLSRTLSPSPPALVAARAFVTSPGYVALGFAACTYDLLDDRWALKLNQVLFVLTVLCAAVMTRMITSSWPIALTSATVVLSRGRLLAGIGLMSPDYMVMFWLTVGLMAATHMLRTGARLSTLVMATGFLIGAMFERTLVVLFLAVPLLLGLGSLARGVLTRPMISHLRGTNRRLRAFNRSSSAGGTRAVGRLEQLGEEGGAFFVRLTHSVRDVLGLEFPERAVAKWRLNYERGSLFRTISLPFMLWAYWQRRWLRISAAWLGAAVLSVAALVTVQWSLSGRQEVQQLLQFHLFAGTGVQFLESWSLALWGVLDLHILVSLGVLLVCAVQAPWTGLPSFFEWSWLLLIVMVLLLGAAFIADSGDVQLVKELAARGLHTPALLSMLPRRVLLWLEPTILSCGIACAYNLMKVLDTRISSR